MGPRDLAESARDNKEWVGVRAFGQFELNEGNSENMRISEDNLYYRNII